MDTKEISKETKIDVIAELFSKVISSTLYNSNLTEDACLGMFKLIFPKEKLDNLEDLSKFAAGIIYSRYFEPPKLPEIDWTKVPHISQILPPTPDEEESNNE